MNLLVLGGFVPMTRLGLMICWGRWRTAGRIWLLQRSHRPIGAKVRAFPDALCDALPLQQAGSSR